MTFFRSRISQKRLNFVLRTKLLSHTNKKPYLIYWIVWWPWPASKRVARFLSDSWVSILSSFMCCCSWTNKWRRRWWWHFAIADHLNDGHTFRPDPWVVRANVQLWQQLCEETYWGVRVPMWTGRRRSHLGSLITQTITSSSRVFTYLPQYSQCTGPCSLVNYNCNCNWNNEIGDGPKSHSVAVGSPDFWFYIGEAWAVERQGLSLDGEYTAHP